MVWICIYSGAQEIHDILHSMDCRGLQSYFVCDNATSHISEDISTLEYSLRLLSLVLVLVLIVLFNCIIAVVLWHGHLVPQATKYLMVCLCIADFGIGIHLTTTIINAVYGRFIFGDIMCKVLVFVHQSMLGVTLFSFGMLLFDKYLAVVYPFNHASIMSRRNTLISIILVWIVIIVVVPITWGSNDNVIAYQANSFNCQQMFAINHIGRARRYYYTQLLVMGSVIGLCNIILNGHMYLVVRRHQRQIRSVAVAQLHVKKGLMKGIKTIILGLTALFLCWTPSVIFNVLPLHLVRVPDWALFMGYICIYCNSFCNWIIYTKTHSLYKTDQLYLFNTLRARFLALRR